MVRYAIDALERCDVSELGRSRGLLRSLTGDFGSKMDLFAGFCFTASYFADRDNEVLQSSKSPRLKRFESPGNVA